MDILYIVMPAYNEEENIEKAVNEWYAVLSDKDVRSRLVVADSGSTDRTHAILEKMKESLPQLEILSDTGRQHGPKVIALYDYAIKNKAEYIFQTDSDGQTDPGEFEEFWNIRDRYDFVCGDRQTGREDGKLRTFIEYIVCLLLRLYFGVKVPDANAPFRLMKADTLGKYLCNLPKDYGLPNIMMTVYFVYYKERYCFKRITFKQRQGGTNSVNMLSIIKTGWKALRDFYVFKKNIAS